MNSEQSSCVILLLVAENQFQQNQLWKQSAFGNAFTIQLNGYGNLLQVTTFLCSSFWKEQ